MKETVFSNKRNFVHKFQCCVQDILRWCVLLIGFTCGIPVYKYTQALCNVFDIYVTSDNLH